MPHPLTVPDERVCPIDGTVFLVGGRGRPPRKAKYCSRRCQGMATYRNLPAEKGSHAPRPRKFVRQTVRNEDWLRTKYIGERLTMQQIAALAGCSTPSVWRAMQDFGIPRRSTAESMPRKRRPRGPIRGGLSLGDYQALHDAQGGLCAACGNAESAVHRNGGMIRLAVDHDHVTGKVRALLCSRCNLSLGYARDDPTVLQQLIDYLARHA